VSNRVLFAAKFTVDSRAADGCIAPVSPLRVLPGRTASAVALATKLSMSRKKINVAIVGLGFGAEFIPLWQKHPQRAEA